ncbi:MAG: hypothetical protein LBO70_00545 [Clostridiales Family XIII bacterium]|nr:hypothetical protein [Clostridiales Family XIII bacterium]
MRKGDMMAKEDYKAGYSEALEGYGVPAQVEISGGSVARSSKRKRRSLVFRPKPKNIIALIVVVAAIVIAVMFATDTLGWSRYANSISTIEEQMNVANGVTTTNYMPVLSADVDWANASDREREGIVKYAVGAVLKEVEKNQTSIFTIMGMTHDRGELIFYYMEDGTVQLYVNGAFHGTVQMK